MSRDKTYISKNETKQNVCCIHFAQRKRKYYSVTFLLQPVPGALIASNTKYFYLDNNEHETKNLDFFIFLLTQFTMNLLS